MSQERIQQFIVRILLCCAMLLMAMTSSQLFAQSGGTIKGKVQLRNQVQVVPRVAVSRYRTSAPAPEADDASVKPDVSNVVVYLEGSGLERVQRPAKPALLDQRNTTFFPHVLPIVKGTSVRIVNRDKTYHNVFSLSNVKKFNIGRRPTGEEVPVNFDSQGVVQVFCDIHSNMSAFIVVLDNPMFIQPGPDGSFEITNVPPGQYTINAWHERLNTPAQQVTVRAGETVTVNFDF